MTERESNRFRIADCGLQIRSGRVRSESAMRGFTLAEVLVASTISGFVALIAVGALNAIAGSAQTVNRTTETTSEIRFAARMIARDLANLYRDPNPQNMKLVGVFRGQCQRGTAVPDLLHVRPSQGPGEPARGRRLRGRVFPGEPRPALEPQRQNDERESSEESDGALSTPVAQSRQGPGRRAAF